MYKPITSPEEFYELIKDSLVDKKGCEGAGLKLIQCVWNKTEGDNRAKEMACLDYVRNFLLSHNPHPEKHQYQ